MGRFIMAGALISAALGSALAFPIAAQAATPAPTTTVSAGHSITPDIAPAGEWQVVATYPDTPAGYTACNTEGAYLVRTYRTDETYACDGAYTLLVYFVPGF